MISSWAAKRNGLPVSLLALDIDHFKAVNDQYGHQAGDALLRAFVEAIRGRCVRTMSLGVSAAKNSWCCCRNMSHEAAAVLAERIRSRVESVLIPFDGTTLSVTVSVGVVKFGVDGDSQDAVFKVADDRLYRVKMRGRTA